MNVRLLGVLVMLIGLIFAYVSYVDVEHAKSKMAGMDIQDYYRKTNGSVFREDLVGVTRHDIQQERDSAQQHINWGLILGAIGFAVAAQGQRKVEATPESTKA